MRNLFLLVLMFMASVAMSQTTPLNEDFEGATLSVSSSGSPGWSLSSSLFNSGAKSDSTAIVNPGDSSVLITNSISTLTNSYVLLEFEHICIIEFHDVAEVYVSADDGSTWTKLTQNEYLGSGGFTTLGGDKFFSGTYPDWQANANSTPTNTMWKHETFDISSIAANAASVKVRFDLVDKNNATIFGNYGWFIDDIKVTTASSEFDAPQITLSSSNPSGAIFGLNVPYIEADITDASGLDTIALIYTKDGGAADTVDMVNVSGNTYGAYIDTTGNPIELGDTFCYYVYAVDASDFHLSDVKPNTGCTEFNIQALPDPVCSVTKSVFPYTQNFSTYSTAGDYCNPAPKTLGQGWINATNDNNEWVPNNIMYVNNIGPTYDHTSGSYSGRMLTLRRCDNKNAIVYTPCFDIRNLTYPGVEFWYFMNGSGVGELKLEILYGGTWHTIWSKSEKVGTSWQKANVSLLDYKHIVKMRFTGTTLYSSQISVSIDDFSVKEGPVNNIGITSIISPSNNSIATDSIIVNMKNFGDNDIQNPKIVYEVNGVIQDTITYNQTLMHGSSTDLFLATYAFTAGSNNVKAWTLLPNGVVDTDPSNDEKSTNYIVCNGGLAGVYTIDANSAPSSTNFLSIQDAFTSMKLCGIADTLTFKIANGTYSVSDFVIDTSICTSDNNLITFESASGNRDDVIIKAESSKYYVFKLIGAKNLTFRNLTFKAATSGNIARIFAINTDNENIKFIGNKFIGRISTSTSQNYSHFIIWSGSKYKNIVFDSNYFYAGTMAIKSMANATNRGQSIIIKNNTFDRVHHQPLILPYCDSVVIENNSIWGNTSTNVASSKIVLNQCTYFSIQNNWIKSKANGIYITSSNANFTKPSIIANNTILSIGTTAGISGIYMKNSKGINCYYNSINTTNTSTTASGLYMEGLTRINIKNNIIQNSGSGYVSYNKGAIDSLTMDYNLLYANGTNFAKIGTTLHTTFSAWQTATSQDANSVSEPITFNSNKYTHTVDLDIYLKGTPLTSVTTDYDGETRHATTPCIGADEFILFAKDAGITQIHRPIAIDSASKIIAVQASMKNFGIDTLFTFDISYSLNGSTAVVTSITDTLIANQTKVYDLTNLTIPYGTNTLEVYTTYANDGDLSNDTTTLNFEGFSSDDVNLIEVYTLGNLPINCGIPHQVKALVKNMSYNKLYNVPVYLNITGVNTWADTVYVDSLAIGESAHIMFDDYSPSVIGLDTVKVSLAIDDELSNNNIQKLQEVTEETFSYVYGTTADTSINVNSQALFSKMNLTGSKIIDEINIYISADANIGDTIFTLALDSSKNVVATSDSLVLSASDLGSYVSFNLYDSLAVLVNTDFYIGIANLGNANNLIGATNESPIRENAFFTSSDLTFTTLSDIATSIEGIPMMNVSMVNPPAFDISITNFISPTDGCGLTSEVVTIELQNNGIDTLIANLPVSYQLKGGNTVTETVAINIIPAGTQQHTFATNVDLSITMDSIFQIRAYTFFVDDANHGNDTSAWFNIVSNYKPNLPIVLNDTINYGDTAFLSATSTDGYALNWYDNNTNGNLIGSGGSYSNNLPTFDTISYYVNAVNNGPANLMISEFVTNPTGTGVGNIPSFVDPLVASTHYVEITNNGGQTADFSNYTFNVYNPTSSNQVHTYTFANGVNLNAGEVMVLDLRSTAADKPAFNYYTLDIQVALWSAHSQAIYLNDASGNLVDALVMGNNIFSDSTGITSSDWTGTLAPTGGLAGLTRIDLDSNKASDWAWSSASLAMTTGFINTSLITTQNGSCASAMQEVKVIVENIPQNETALLQIISPVNTMNTQVANSIEVSVQNNGLIPLTSLNINWTMNNGTINTFAWTGSLAVDSNTTINIGNYTPQGGLYDLKVWTSLPNNVVDIYPINDTLNSSLESSLIGTYTIGNTTGMSFDFNTVAEVVNALNQVGISGAVVFEFATGSYTANELDINNINGVSPINTIVFKSASNNKNDVIINTTADYALKLNGATNIYIKHISFETSISTSTISYQRILMLSNNNSVDIQNCRFTGVSTNIGITNKALIYSYNSKDSVLIDSCEFKYGGYGLSFTGSSNYSNKALVVKNSTFTSIAGWAIKISRSDSIVATNNTIIGDNAYSDGIYVIYGTNVNITNNHLTKMDNGIYLGNSTGTAVQPLIIANNIIQGKNNGIKLGYSVKYGHIIHNTVEVTGSSSSSTSGNALHTSSGSSSSSSDSTKIYNNIFIQKGSGYIHYMSGTYNPTLKFNYNNYFSSVGTKFMRINNVNYSTYAAYKLAYPNDSNSDTLDVIFASATDLHCIDPRLDGHGTASFSIATDIDGETRSTTNPDMGADEYDVFPIDAKSVSFTSFALIQPIGASQQVGINVINFGTSDLTSIPVSYEYNGIIVNDTIAYTIPALQQHTHYFSLPINVVSGVNSLKAYTHIANDGNLNNDTLEINIHGILLSSPNYESNFETNNDFIADNSNNIWQYGTPSAIIIDSAYSPINAWATTLAGNTQAIGVHYLYTPYFEVNNTMDTLAINFMKIHDLDTNNVTLEMKNGVNGLWSSVGYITDPLSTNWYNAISNGVHSWRNVSNGWENTNYKLSTSLMGANDTIQFRFKYTGINNLHEGFAIDNFSLKIQNDIALNSITHPINDTLVGTQVYAKVNIKNNGLTTINSIPLELTIDGNTVISETVNTSIAPGSDLVYSFTTAYTVPNQAYQLCIVNTLNGDGNSSNDTICANLGITSLPVDVALNSILSPVSTNGTICVDQTFYTYNVEIEIQNLGDDTIKTLPIEYMINNTNTVQETWTGLLLAGQTTNYTFTQAWAPTNTGNLELCVKATLTDDIDITNNTICETYVGDICSGIDSRNSDLFNVSQNRPNPTNGLTSIDVYLPTSGKTTLKLYSQLGVLILDNEYSFANGNNTIELNLNDLSVGVYYYSVQFKDKVYTHKLVIK